MKFRVSGNRLLHPFRFLDPADAVVPVGVIIGLQKQVIVRFGREPFADQFNVDHRISHGDRRGFIHRTLDRIATVKFDFGPGFASPSRKIQDLPICCIDPKQGRTLFLRGIMQVGNRSLSRKINAVEGCAVNWEFGDLDTDLIIKLQLRIELENHQFLAGIHPKGMLGGSVFVPVSRYTNRRTWNNSGIIRAQILGNFLHLMAFQWAKGDGIGEINGLHLRICLERGQ